MKRYGRLFDEFCSFRNLYFASIRAQKGKKYKTGTAAFNFNLEQNLLRIRTELIEGRYKFGEYTSFYVHDPKTRLISAAPYCDRVVHHAVCGIIEPIFERTFIFDLYSNRKGKGTHRAIDRYQEFCRVNEYVLKCDVRRYFDSIDKKQLLDAVRRKIKDRKMLALIKDIIWSYAKNEDQPDIGLPLGNLTSQLFANIYLNELDHFIKEILGCRYYIRYVDDFVIFENSKHRLSEVKRHIQDFLEGYKLRLHPDKSHIRKVSEGVCFLGCRIFPEYRLIHKSNVIRFKRRLRKFQRQYKNNQVSLQKIFRSMRSWEAHAKHADSYRLRKELFEKFVFSRG